MVRGPGTGTGDVGTLPLPREQTDTTENITFPQLCWRVVTIYPVIIHSFQVILLSLSTAFPDATNSSALGNALCSTVLTLSAKVSSVSSGNTGTDSCTNIAPASTSS